MKPIGRNVNVKKVSTIAIVTNALQVGLVVGMVLYVLLVPHAELDTLMAKYILVIAASVVVWGAVVDIREALSTRRLLGQLDDMDSTIEAMESLNNTLRAAARFPQPPPGGIQPDGDGGIRRGQRLY